MRNARTDKRNLTFAKMMSPMGGFMKVPEFSINGVRYKSVIQACDTLNLSRERLLDKVIKLKRCSQFRMRQYNEEGVNTPRPYLEVELRVHLDKDSYGRISK